MFNQNSIVSTLKYELSTDAFMRFLATDQIILQDYSGEFLLGIYQNRDWKLSYLGADTNFYSLDEIYTYFDKEHSKLFKPPATKYYYGNSGIILRLTEDSAYSILKQTQEDWVSRV